MDALYAAVQRSLTLEETIRAEIRARGPMPFARFMEMALYHPELGYYRATPSATTRSGDFLTAPETHPIFGALLARFARAAAAALDARPFTLVEQGPGTGALAETFRAYWSRAYPDVPLRHLLVEPGPAARDRLSQRLGPGVEVVPSLDEVAPFEGVYLSNELPDAFPVHRARRREGALVEVAIDVDHDRLVEIEVPAAPEIAAYLERAGIHLAEGAEIEANLSLAPWLASVGAVLRRGYVLTLDYGYAADEAARFPRGTLLAHYRHATNEDFTERIGRQDLTAHACWTALERFGEEAGLHTLERTTQRDFLTRWGWKEYGRRRLVERAAPEELDAIDRLGRMEDGLGGLGVLLQARGDVAWPDPEAAGAPEWETVPS